MSPPNVDTRKLKDQASELLGKSKYDKAAEVLEQLARLEPKDMQHRLKLGDTYRRLGIEEKAILAYQVAGRQFADEGQLIKAIAAFKVILQIDPKNETAQQDLAQMNSRRFARPTLESVGLAAPKGIGAGARGVSEQELAESQRAAAQVSAMFEGGRASFDAPEEGDGDAPLELDLPARGPSRPGQSRPPAKPAPAATPAAPVPAKFGTPAPEPRRAPPPKIRTAIELGMPAESEGAPKPPPSSARSEAELEEIEVEESDGPEEELVILESEEIVGTPTMSRAAPSRLAPAAGPAKAASARPIADLLAGDDEIELLSISSDEPDLPPAPKEPPMEAATTGEFEAVFTKLVPEKPARRPAKVPLFDDLPPQAFLELVNRLHYKRWAPGEIILREGDPGRSFFVIAEGKVRVYKKLENGSELPLATLGEGAFFGEMALLSGAARTANVVAEEETELLEISDQLLREIVGRYPSVAQSLKNFYRQRLVNNVMAISPLFRDFDQAERRSIIERFKMKQAAAGEVFIREAQGADGLYVVLHGGVRVTKQLGDGREVELARLKEGEMFGEMSLLTNEPASATVTALGTTILLRLPPEHFQELIITHPQILELVSELTDKRRSAIAAVLSGHGPGVDGMSFV